MPGGATFPPSRESSFRAWRTGAHPRNPILLLAVIGPGHVGWLDGSFGYLARPRRGAVRCAAAHGYRGVPADRVPARTGGMSLGRKGRRRVATGANHPASRSSAFRRGPGTPAGAPTGDQSTAMHVTPKPPLVRQDRITSRSAYHRRLGRPFSRFQAAFQARFPRYPGRVAAAREAPLRGRAFQQATPLRPGGCSAPAAVARRPGNHWC